MTKIQNDKPVWVIGYYSLEFICILVLVFWYLVLFKSGGQALKSRVKLHVAGTVNRLNVEHRTPNIER